MDKVHKFQDTTSTSFFNANTQSGLSQGFPLYKPLKSAFADIIEGIDGMNDHTPIMLMQEQLNGLRKRLRGCEEGIGKIQELEELKTVIEKMQLELAMTRERYLQQHSEVKQEIDNMIACLEKQLQNYKKDWQKIRNKCQQQITEKIEQITTQKLANQNYIASAMKTTSLGLRQEISQFTHELKLSKKNRNFRTAKLFSHLETVRNNLSAMVIQEESKRSQYDEIIYGLLDKTCENAASALRRRVF